jgi:murein DD-endopeptidase MepM/ murein hydrolase activator NlpD
MLKAFFFNRQSQNNLNNSRSASETTEFLGAAAIGLKWLVRVALVLLCLSLLILPGVLNLVHIFNSPAIAQTTASVENLRQQQQKIQQERSRLNQQQERLQNQQQQAETRLEGLQDHIETASDKIAYNEQQLAIANKRLNDLQADLDKAERFYQERQFSTVARLRFLQRQQDDKGWVVLLQSQNINEFLDRRRQLKLVYEADQKILRELKADADELDRRRRNIARQKNEIALLTQQLQAQKSEYQAQAQTEQTLIERLRKDRQALEAAETQLEQDSANLTMLIRQRISAPAIGTIVVRGTGQFSFPSDGRLTSGFGQRVHPILGYRRFHAGIDFGSSHGSPIRAADTGRVIYAGWYGGYGRSIIVDHGDNLTTLYAHASQLYVSEGQTVQKGQAIAAVGSTGLSTGPHLHFEVRVNGSPVNPLEYL